MSNSVDLYRPERPWKSPPPPQKPVRQKMPGWLLWVIGALVVALLVTSGVLIWKGNQKHYLSAPLPAQATQSATPNQKAVGPDGTAPVLVSPHGSAGSSYPAGSHVVNGILVGADGKPILGSDGKPIHVGTPESGTTLSHEDLTDASDEGGNVDPHQGSSLNPDGTAGGAQSVVVSKPTMGNDSVFVPGASIYAPIIPTSGFKASRYADFNTLMIPSNPRHVAWYDKGAPLVGGTQGTTLIAGHVAYSGMWGAFYNLYDVHPGYVAWTRDANGHYQKWQATNIYYQKHTAFSQDYWKNTGTRQLVLVTCGGAPVGGHYVLNIFAVFKPVSS